MLLVLGARTYRGLPCRPVERHKVKNYTAAHYTAGHRALMFDSGLRFFTPYIALALGFGLLLTTESDPAVRDTLEGRGVLYGAVLVTFAVVLR